MPWERSRLSPVEIEALYEGQRWRRSRDMEVFAELIVWLRAAQGAETEYDQVLGSLPGYDREHFRKIDEMREQAMKKMKKGKRG